MDTAVISLKYDTLLFLGVTKFVKGVSDERYIMQ